MMRLALFAAILAAPALAACASFERSMPFGPPPPGPFIGSGAAAGWGVRFPQGYGWENPLLDPGPAGAGAFL
jgi:hypothetical protein